MHWLTYVLLVLVPTAWALQLNPCYMIVCPDSIRPGMEFTVKYSKLCQTPKFRMEAAIMTSSGTIDNDYDFKNMMMAEDIMVEEPMVDMMQRDAIIVQDSLTVKSRSKTASLTLMLPRDIQPASSYLLEVRGVDLSDNTVLFKNSTTLKYRQKSLSIFIQTDKAMYKPGHTVQYRIVATDPDLGVIKGPMDISIYDPNSNKIVQLKNVQRPSGVYQGSLKLSDQPPLGTWNLEVEFMGTSKTREITVAEYVLPKFEVKVKLPSFGLTTDTYLSGKVEARYTFEEAVKGKGTITISRLYSEETYSLAIKEINAVHEFEIPLSVLRKTFGANLEYYTLTVTAVVEEGLTSVNQEDSEDIRYYTNPEKMTIIDELSTFKQGLPNTLHIFVSDQDDRPLSQPGTVVKITASMYDSEYGGSETAKPYSKSIDVPINGLIAFTFTSTNEATESVRITAETAYNTVYRSLSKFQSKSKVYIQATVLTKNPQTGETCKFKMTTTKRGKKTVNYMIIAKGLVVHQGQFTTKKTKKTWSVVLTSAAAPTAKCVVYYVHNSDPEVIADSIEFNVKMNFDNKVKVDYVKPNGKRLTDSKPGKNIYVRVSADPGSQCNVLTVDKSVKLLKSGNDITPAMISEEMELYDNKPPTPCLGFICPRMLYPVPIQGVDVTDIFQNSGLQVLTDAFLYDYRPYFPYYRAMAMPVMADMEMQFAKSGPPPPQNKQRVRTKFPETWIYESAVADSNGTALIKKTVPDTVTTWVSSAFAVSDDKGLGVALNTAELTSFLSFFVRLDLPYSVIRLEQVVIQANVFNFFKEDLEVEVTLKMSKDFQVILVKQNLRGRANLVYKNQDVVQIVKVPAGTGVAVNFPIVPTKIGNIDIQVTARSNSGGDTVIKQLLCEAEGIEKNDNIAVLINKDRNSKSFFTTRDIVLPDNVVPGSVRIQISAMGDLMGPSITGLANLLRMPYGCGEQNMLAFVPNIVVIRYLDIVDSLKPEDEAKGKENMEAGYQRELTYMRHDGSFSAFGNSDAQGSTWLTAFVVKSFAQAEPFIFIDPAMMKRSIEWILTKFTSPGTFTESGNVIHKEMQGGGSASASNLAIYVTTCLLEASLTGFGASIPSLLPTISSTISEIETNVASMEDVYELAITSYALALSGSLVAEDVLDILDEMKSTTEDGLTFWKVIDEPETNGDIWMPPYHQARAQNIETTAYVLLAYSVLGRINDGLPVLKWLVKQRNPYGGFGSTQDTVIALQAMAEFAALIYSPDFNLDITVSDQQMFSHEFMITPDNALLYQTVQAPDTSRVIDIIARGYGMALVEIAVNYNVWADLAPPLFNLRLSYTDETIKGFKLKVCFSWLGKGKSGMTLLEIKLLSGFAAEKFTISNLDIMKRLEDGDKSLVIYLEEVQSLNSYCIDVRMQRQELVAGTQPAMVQIFDYYDKENRASSFYQPAVLKDSNVCDLGENFCV